MNIKRNWLGITAVLLALAVSVSIAAKAPAKKSAKPPTKVKVGACCPGSVATKNTKCAVAAKSSKNAAAKPKPAKTENKALPRLVDLGATTCIPCKMMTPILDELSKEYKGKLKVEFIDVRENREAAEKYNIQSIPTQIFYDAKGKELYRHQGYYPKEDILKKLKELGIKL